MSVHRLIWICCTAAVVAAVSGYLALDFVCYRSSDYGCASTAMMGGATSVVYPAVYRVTLVARTARIVCSGVLETAQRLLDPCEGSSAGCSTGSNGPADDVPAEPQPVKDEIIEVKELIDLGQSQKCQSGLGDEKDPAIETEVKPGTPPDCNDAPVSVPPVPITEDEPATMPPADKIFDFWMQMVHEAVEGTAKKAVAEDGEAQEDQPADEVDEGKSPNCIEDPHYHDRYPGCPETQLGKKPSICPFAHTWEEEMPEAKDEAGEAQEEPETDGVLMLGASIYWHDTYPKLPGLHTGRPEPNWTPPSEEESSEDCEEPSKVEDDFGNSDCRDNSPAKDSYVQLGGPANDYDVPPADPAWPIPLYHQKPEAAGFYNSGEFLYYRNTEKAKAETKPETASPPAVSADDGQTCPSTSCNEKPLVQNPTEKPDNLVPNKGRLVEVSLYRLIEDHATTTLAEMPVAPRRMINCDFTLDSLSYMEREVSDLYEPLPAMTYSKPQNSNAEAASGLFGNGTDLPPWAAPAGKRNQIYGSFEVLIRSFGSGPATGF